VLCALLLALFFTKEAAWHAVLRFLIFGLLKTALDIFCPPYPGSTRRGGDLDPESVFVEAGKATFRY
jgi:hypothetical protein